jgi:SAM-dependent methyltransferase
MMSTEPETALLREVADYYSSKLIEYGQTPRGVDWNGAESQTLRFVQLCKVICQSPSFSINDLGCGYGALLDYLGGEYEDLTYTGIDVSPEMVGAAVIRNRHHPKANFVVASEPVSPADYGIASGIFNVRLRRTDAEWQAYIEASLNTLNRTSRLGFAFNCLTSYSDPDRMRDYLYYADPCMLFDLCKRLYSKNVALLHDYGLYEFTILVKKQA